MSRNRILQVSPHYFPETKFGGPPVKIFGLAKALIGRDYDVRAVTFHSENRKKVTKETIDRVQIQYLPWIGWGTRQFAVESRRLREAIEQSEIVHAFGLYNFLTPLAGRLARQLNKPFVVEPLGTYLPKARNQTIKRIYHKLFTKEMFRFAKAVIATSEAEKTELIDVVPSGRLHVRGNGIDLLPAQSEKDREQARKTMGLAPDTLMILFVGRVSPVKNLEMLIASYHEAKLIKSRLYIVGPLAEESYVKILRGQIREKSLEAEIILTGPLYGAEKVAAYAAADFLVLPSLSESYGNAAAEAVSAGLPVLLTDTCGIAPLIAGRAGLAVSCSKEGLTAGLEAIADPERRRSWLGSRSDLITLLSWEGPLNEQIQIYQKVSGFEMLST